MATEDLLQPGHVVKERWKVVSLSLSLFYIQLFLFVCVVLFFFSMLEYVRTNPQPYLFSLSTF